MKNKEKLISTSQISSQKDISSPQDNSMTNFSIDSVIGSVTYLMTNSPLYEHIFISDLKWLVIPAILNKQFRLFKKGKVPICYMSYANINNDIEKRFFKGNVKLSPNEWNSGDKIYMIDIIAPFGSQNKFLEEFLSNEQFANKNINILVPDNDEQSNNKLKSVILSEFLKDTSNCK